MNVLIIDDDLGIRETLGMALETSGHCDDVGAALTSFAKNYVITQLVMGRARASRSLKRFFSSLVDGLSQKLSGVDIILS